jgi:MFS family permease
MADSSKGFSKQPEIDSKISDEHLESTTVAITNDENGNTVITREDGEVFTIDKKAERKLLWKFDLRILPLLTMMYLFNALDKANMGNAATVFPSPPFPCSHNRYAAKFFDQAGLLEDLGMENNDKYNILLSIFFIPYVLTAPFLGMVGKIYGPSRVLPAMMFTFGSMTLLTTAATNWGGLVALRWFLGMAESAFFPLVIYYQTSFYRRGELARRLAIFYAASNIAYAFGGLLAFGVFQIQGGALATWRYLFVLEGSLTVIASVVAFLFLPYSAAHAKFLTEDEKKLAFYRIQIDSSAVVNEKFNLRDAAKIFKQPTSWVILCIEICLGIPLQGVALFLPQIVARLGYDTVQTNLHTVAPNITGAVMLLILAYSSDYTRWRFPFIALGFFWTFCGFIIYAAINVEADLRVAYFACFMMTWGTSAPSVLLDVWYNNNIVSAAVVDLYVAIANALTFSGRREPPPPPHFHWRPSCEFDGLGTIEYLP